MKTSALQVLEEKGFKAVSDLNYCTEMGSNYYIGFKGNIAAVVAIIENEDNYFLSKQELIEMSFTATQYNVKEVYLFTNYGCELHSRYDKPLIVGFTKIEKLIL